ncbi:MAG TPA: response regulator [Chitinophagaceae bacterium]
MQNKITCLIDDDEIYLFSVKRTIEVNQLSHRVLEFRNGQEAIDFFLQRSKDQAELPDVILLDINMPVMDGWEFIEAFRGIQPLLEKHISLYVVSSSVDLTDVQRAKSFSSVNDYLVKPLTANQLRTIYQPAG